MSDYVAGLPDYVGGLPDYVGGLPDYVAGLSDYVTSVVEGGDEIYSFLFFWRVLASLSHLRFHQERAFFIMMEKKSILAQKNSIVPYYNSMISRDEPNAFSQWPRNVLEVRLPLELWRRIKVVAELQGLTYSWVVRFCLFRLIMRSQPRNYIGFRMRAEPLKGAAPKLYYRNLRAVAQKSAGAFHRHRLCLYGEDELYIRMVSALLGVTMTHLVRLAIECNLERLERASYRRPGRFFRVSLYWLGVKRYRDVDFHIRLPENATMRMGRFDRNSYW